MKEVETTDKCSLFVYKWQVLYFHRHPELTEGRALISSRGRRQTSAQRYSSSLKGKFSCMEGNKEKESLIQPHTWIERENTFRVILRYSFLGGFQDSLILAPSQTRIAVEIFQNNFLQYIVSKDLF